MNLRDLTYVIAVAEHQNFTRAAEAANVSQPALSGQIKKLEAELGVEIFDRGDKSVRLTPFGETMVEASRQIGSLVEHIRASARSHGDAEATTLRLGMTPTLAAYVSGHFQRLVEACRPGRRIVVIEGKPADLAQMVERGAIDVALVARRTYDALTAGGGASFAFTSLWREPLYLCVRRGNPLASRSAISARDVPRDQFIRFATPFGYELEKDLPAPSPDAAEQAGIDMRTARFETVCRQIAFTDAHTIVNGIAAEQFRQDKLGLEFIAFEPGGNLRELGAITREEASRQDLLTALVDQVRSDPPVGALKASNVEDAGGRGDVRRDDRAANRRAYRRTT